MQHLSLFGARCCTARTESGWFGCEVLQTPEPDLSRLPAIFRERRAVSGLSFDQLAERSGISRRTLINISTGKYRGDLKTWMILARTWGMTLDGLLASAWDDDDRPT